MRCSTRGTATSSGRPSRQASLPTPPTTATSPTTAITTTPTCLPKSSSCGVVALRWLASPSAPSSCSLHAPSSTPLSCVFSLHPFCVIRCVIVSTYIILLSIVVYFFLFLQCDTTKNIIIAAINPILSSTCINNATRTTSRLGRKWELKVEQQVTEATLKEVVLDGLGRLDLRKEVLAEGGLCVSCGILHPSSRASEQFTAYLEHLLTHRMVVKPFSFALLLP